MCCKEGLACCTTTGRGQVSSLLARTAAGLWRWMCSPGCPKLSCRTGSLHKHEALCWGRDSAACQGQHSACPRSSPGYCEEKLCEEQKTPVRQGRVLLLSRNSYMGSGNLTDPDLPRIFSCWYVKGKVKEGVTIKLSSYLPCSLWGSQGLRAQRPGNVCNWVRVAVSWVPGCLCLFHLEPQCISPSCSTCLCYWSSTHVRSIRLSGDGSFSCRVRHWLCGSSQVGVSMGMRCASLL